MTFAQTLQQLPSIDNIASVTLQDAAGQTIASIDNLPGKAGSLAVYHALVKQFGAITPEAAKQGLVWFAEHTQDAQANPGKHPNVDRLLKIIDSGSGYQAAIISKA